MTNAAQPRASLMEHVMLRRILVSMTFLIGLSLAPAVAQTGGFCSKFDSGIDGWGACASGPNITVTMPTDSGGITPTDTYLKLTDLSGASSACSTDAKYLGDWNAKMGGCGQFCFDFKVFSSGSPPTAITPSFTIYGPGVSRATFVANLLVPVGDTTWHQNICAPVALGAVPPPSPNGHWVVTGGSWNSIITGVTRVSLPVDFSSSPSEVVGYDNLCMTPGGCGEKPPPEVTGCLKDMKVDVKCNADGTYTVALSGAGFSGSDITLTSQTPGVTVAPPQQPWAATTTWTISGATPGQTVVLTANEIKLGGGSAPGIDQCCAGEIKIVMPECKKPIDLKIGKEDTPHAGRGKWFNLWVTNVGAPITFPAGGLTVTDVIPSGMTVTSVVSPPGWTCAPTAIVGPGSIICTYNLAGSLATNAVLGTIMVNYTTTGPGPFTNCAKVAISSAVDGNPANDTACVTVTPTQVGSLIVKKEVIYNGPITLPSLSYPVTVTCGSTVTNLNLINGVPQTVSNIPLNTVCSVVEGTVPTPPNICPPPTTPVWSTVYVPPSPVTITGMGITETVKNTLLCKQVPPPPPSCRPPMIPGAVAGLCNCPVGTVQKGKECVRPIVCRPPLVSNAAGSSCGCPQGTVQRGKECIKQPVCNPPAKLNRRGVCECPADMVARGNSCIERERPRPQISPGDIIRNIPGGGRDNDNLRGGRDIDSPRGGGQGPADFPGRR